jgi:hypothetical protein
MWKIGVYRVLIINKLNNGHRLKITNKLEQSLVSSYYKANPVVLLGNPRITLINYNTISYFFLEIYLFKLFLQLQ